jgi:hypothetical protein
MFVEELFSLVKLQTYLCNNDSIFETQKIFYRNYLWRLTLEEQAPLTVTKTLTLTPTEDMTKTLLLKVGAKLMFVQGHRTLGILVVSILSLEVLVV